jgi:hypothetical protein
MITKAGRAARQAALEGDAAEELLRIMHVLDFATPGAPCNPNAVAEHVQGVVEQRDRLVEALELVMQAEAMPAEVQRTAEDALAFARQFQETPRGRLLTADELVARTPPLRWLIPGVLALRTVVLLSGANDEHKRGVLLDLALTVAQHHPVIFVTTRAAADQDRPRIQAWRDHHGLESGHLFLRTVPLHLGDQAELWHVLGSSRPIQPALILIDDLEACGASGSLDVSDAGESWKAVQGLDTLRRLTGATVLVAHAIPPTAEPAVLVSTASAEYHVTTDAQGVIHLTCWKQRHAAKPAPRTFRLEHPPGSHGTAVLVPTMPAVPWEVRRSQR